MPRIVQHREPVVLDGFVKLPPALQLEGEIVMRHPRFGVLRQRVTPERLRVQVSAATLGGKTEQNREQERLKRSRQQRRPVASKRPRGNAPGKQGDQPYRGGVPDNGLPRTSTGRCTGR